MATYAEKKRRLDAIIGAGAHPAVAFSGGVDSSLVAALAVKHHGEKATLFSVVTPYMDESDVFFAAAVAATGGWPLQWIRLDPLSRPEIAQNPKDRCYHCKKLLFSAIRGRGEEKGSITFWDGSNADDADVYRPGTKAVAEQGFSSPLAEAGLSKEDVRRYAAELVLPSATRPSKPCLLTRFPYDLPKPVTAADLDAVKIGERRLKAYLKDDFRLRRLSDEEALIEASPFDQQLLAIGGKAIFRELPFTKVSVAAEPFRSGSFDRKENL